LLVCHCQRICDRTIRASIQEGARSIKEVGKACGAGRGCGGCRPTIAELLVEERRPDASACSALVVLDTGSIRLAS
jgi:bacterioferritin-associated ferredoxin